MRHLEPREAGLLPAANKANVREQGLSPQRFAGGLPEHCGKVQLWGKFNTTHSWDIFQIYNIDNLDKFTVGKFDKS